MRHTRRAFTLIELLVSMGIIGILVALLLPAVQSARAASRRVACGNQLHQLGLAMIAYHDVHGSLPAGVTCRSQQLTSGDCTAFTKLLPFLEQAPLHSRYHFGKPWHDAANYNVVISPLRAFVCPANRQGQIGLDDIADTWSTSLPPSAATTDYALCKGACGALVRDSRNIPGELRGVFDVNSEVSFGQIIDGLSHTIAAGDAVSGVFLARDLNDPSRPATELTTGQSPRIEQAWAAGSTSNRAYPYYGSVFAVTGQRGGARPIYEPMNPNSRLVAPTVDGNDNFENRNARDVVSGFRSLHTGGCQFVFCDGSVRFLISETAPRVFVDLSTMMGG